MPEPHDSSRDPNDRASFHAAIDETFAHGATLIAEIRERRLHHARTAESLIIERRVLRDDFAHWADENR